MTLKIGVIGAGPAGMMAALQAAQRGARVTLFDGNSSVGRKLLATGNGRCNLTNAAIVPERYICTDSGWLRSLFAVFGREELLAFLHDMAVFTYATADGWYYPVSNSAATAVAAFETALRLAKVDLQLQTRVTDIRPLNPGFSLQAGAAKFRFDRLIIACGGKAYPALGSTGDCLPLLARLGHKIVPVLPALVPLLTDIRPVHKLQGVRLDVGLSLYRGDEKLGEEYGNMLFTDTGLSGPAPMNLSHLVSKNPGEKLHVEINFILNHQQELDRLFQEKRHTALPLAILLGAAMPPKVPPVLLLLAGLPAEITCAQTGNQDWQNLQRVVTGLNLIVKGTRSFEAAQVSSGGVPLNEVHPQGLASRCCPGLYLAGEVLDVIGPCGGYNLQFAFSSGAAAGIGATVM